MPAPAPSQESGADPLVAHETCDLVASLVHTLDQKLQALGGRPAESEQRAAGSRDMYRDPSLHRSYSASSQLQVGTDTRGGLAAGLTGWWWPQVVSVRQLGDLALA